MNSFCKEIINYKNFKDYNEINHLITAENEFSNNKLSELVVQSVEKVLMEEKLKNPNKIPYVITCCLSFPGKFILFYMIKNRCIYEYIKTNPNGVVFREKNFLSFNHIVFFLIFRYIKKKNHMKQKLSKLYNQYLYIYVFPYV